MVRHDTPEGRIAIQVRELIVKVVKPYPNVPDWADIEAHIKPYVRFEILSALLAQMEKHGTFAEAIVLMTELELVKNEIGQRKATERGRS